MVAATHCIKIGCLLLLSVSLFHSPAAGDQQEVKPTVAQFMIGQMRIPNDNDRVSGGDYEIPLLGFAFQNPYAGTVVQYGLEGGALFSWKSDTRSFAASGGGGGGSVSVSLDIESLLVDLFFGVYAAYEPIHWFRLYLGAGPLLIYGDRETERVDPATMESQSASDSGLDVGGYARFGMDFIFTDNVIIGLGVRGTKTGLTFSDDTGDVDVEGFQYYVGLSSKF